MNETKEFDYSVELSDNFAEPDLQRTRELLDEALSIGHIGSWEWDYQTHGILWSDECYRIVGVDRDTFFPTNESFRALIHPDDMTMLDNLIEESLNGKDYLKYEYRIIRPDGEIRYVHATRKTYYSESGKALRSLGTVQDITERKHIELEIKRLKENLEQAQGIARIGSWERDYLSGAHFWSDESYRIFGVDKNTFELNNESVISLRHPDDREMFKKVIEDAINGKSYSEYEYRIIRPDGELRYIYSTTRIFYDESGKPIRAIGVNQDITERKIAEIETKRIKEYFEEAQRNAHIGIWERNLRTDEFFWSDESYRIYGVDKCCFTPTSDAIMELRHPEDREKARLAIAESINGKNYLEHEYRITRPNGEIRFIHATRKTHFDENGIAIRGIGTIQDVTERKISELEIARIQRNLEEAQSVGHIGSWERDLTTNEMLWSDETYRIYGLDPKGARITYEKIVAMRHPDDLTHVNEAVRETIDGKDFTEYEYRIIRPDGEIRDIHVTRRTNYDSSGKAIRAIGSIQDITERKTAEAMLQKANEELRQLSIRDSLTGLFNRRYLEETLVRELHRADREKNPVGIMMIDIDHFKYLNDLSGHDAGDALLRELGAYLRTNTRGEDIVCRFGGEEFVAVLPGATVEKTRERAEEIRRGVKELSVYHLGKPLQKCTISIGVSGYPEHGSNSETVLKSADIALYRAKDEGRDRVIVFGG